MLLSFVHMLLFCDLMDRRVRRDREGWFVVGDDVWHRSAVKNPTCGRYKTNADVRKPEH